jgi:peptide/nickel transport system permease protein
MRMHPVLRTVLQRLALGVITLFAVSILIFSMVEFLPGDFATKILGKSATPETVKAFEHEIGIDRPADVRYIEWIDKVAHGDFGSSYASRADYRRTVAEIIIPR